MKTVFALNEDFEVVYGKSTGVCEPQMDADRFYEPTDEQVDAELARREQVYEELGCRHWSHALGFSGWCEACKAKSEATA